MSESTSPRLAREAKRAATLSPESYAALQRFVRDASGIVLDGDKRYLLESRLTPVLASSAAKSLSIHTLDDLSRVVSSRSTADLRQLILNAITTNETLFFRDAGMFDALQKHVFPARLDGKRMWGKLRIWSAASSSGQEAYSLAMVLQHMGRGAGDVEILGTDISTEVLERARQARYADSEVKRGLAPEFLSRYFRRIGGEWQLSDPVRSMVRFEEIDLRRDIRRLGRFDLILCRNVLIYFDTVTRQHIFTELHGMLPQNGFLALGCAETVINLHQGFQRQQIGHATFYSRA